MTKLLL